MEHFKKKLRVPTHASNHQAPHLAVHFNKKIKRWQENKNGSIEAPPPTYAERLITGVAPARQQG